MKRVRTVLVGVRSTGSRPAKDELVSERLRAQDFAVSKACRYGFPYQPTSVAVDSVQGIVAIGTYTGCLRIFGKPGIEAHVQHDSSSPVRNLVFMSNEGALLSCCPEDSIHLWNLRQAEPVIVQSLRFNRERITALHLPFTSKWLFVGTEKGNVHIVNIERFEVSGYMINWNKAIELHCKTHPGPVIQISDNPLDANKILLGFESGTMVIWSLRSKSAEQRFCCPQKSLTSLYWLNDGKQFMCSHTDGTLSVWNMKCTDKPAEVLSPHANAKSGKDRPCAPISKVKWLATSSGDPMIIFSGGTPRGKRKGLTVCQGKAARLLTNESILDFTVILSTPWTEDVQDPKVVIAVTPFHLLVYDLVTSSSKPLSFNVPYAFDVHESPVTCTQYFSDCPPDCITDIGHVGNKPKKRHLSREASRQVWPIMGGVSGDQPGGPPTELVITGHSDGSVKFWDASTAALFLLYKMSTSKNFDREKSKSSEESSDNTEPRASTSEGSETSNHRLSQDEESELYAVQMINFCVHSRILLVAGSSYVLLYQFSLTEQAVELVQIDIYQAVEPYHPSHTPTSSTQDSAFIQPDDRSSTSSTDFLPESVSLPAVTGKTGTFKRHPGFQADLLCVLSGNQEGWPISNISQSSQLGIVCICSGPSLALVDVVQKSLITVLSADEMTVLSEAPFHGPQTPQPQTPITPITPGTPLTFTINMDTSGGLDFTEPFIQKKEEKKKTKPARPPPPLRTKSYHNKNSESSNGNDQVEGQGHSRVNRSVSYPSASEGPPDTVQCTTFACTYTKKNDNCISPCLLVGTTKGNVYIVVINMPPAEERLLQPILTLVTGTVFRPKSGMVLSLSLLDHQGHLFPSPLRFWTDKKDENQLKKTVTAKECSEKHFLVVNTEREAKVYQLPPTHTNPTIYSKTSVADDSSVVLTSEVIVIEGSSCLMCLTSLGQLMAFSLPSLTMLISAECSFLLTDFRYLRTLKFSDGGLAITMCSPHEIQKLCLFTRNDKYQMSGQMSLFRPMDMPERPTKGFFTSLFSSQASPLDREELFGVQSGSASRSIAERVQGPGIEQLQEVSVGLAGAMQKNRDALLERGEKLHHLDKATADLALNAQNFADMSNQIKLKYKEKKWYQV